ncbi:hypothetical protein JOF56_000056 [Kibdelosporangium banguiense]|uniref:Uncharacterized protein n=1 Tax=Kibdelosporangium banguiense TaxID=1365924 RepID=A0ABS4T5V6_9PSEU|nr:hypothetical protein [Kibdelosporangium banguiense]MBP2319671.1 hypothetical protein [Kibdelosporangium banguiense]
MFAVYVAAVQVVDVIGMHDRVVSAARAMGVAVGLGLVVLDSGHRLIPSAVSSLLNGRMRIRASQLGSVTIKPMG